MILTLLLALERTGVSFWCISLCIAHLTLQIPVIFPVQATNFGFLSGSASGSGKYHLFSKRKLFLIGLFVLFCLVLMLASESGKMAFLGILHFPAVNFLTLLQEADLDSLCHLESFILWLLLGFSQWRDRSWKEKRDTLGIYSSCFFFDLMHF